MAKRTTPPPKEMHEIEKPLAFIKCGEVYSIQYYNEMYDLQETAIKYSPRELMEQYSLYENEFENMVA